MSENRHDSNSHAADEDCDKECRDYASKRSLQLYEQANGRLTSITPVLMLILPAGVMVAVAQGGPYTPSM